MASVKLDPAYELSASPNVPVKPTGSLARLPFWARCGYHLNKRHWNTVVLDGDVPQGEIKRMIDRSYGLVVKSLKIVREKHCYYVMERKHYLSSDEVRYFTSKSNVLAWRTFVVTWAILLAVFWMVDSWTNPFTVLLAIVLLAGRQLGLAVITHECGHNTFFESRALNSTLGQFLAANVVFSDLHAYARGHTRHHKHAGTHDDPDLPNYQAYPVPRDSFRRKVIRDLTGQTGYKLLRFVLRSAGGIFSSDPGKRQTARPFVQQILVNMVFAVCLGWLFSPWIYLLWLVTFVTTHMLIVRIRQVAEHAAVPDPLDLDPRKNTRTTIPAWWERLFFAPNYVNYHLEHHFMAGVPCYRLKELHELLQQRGAYTHTPIFHGYREVLLHAVA